MSKNSELAGVLIKFEERVKQRDKKLDEASNTESMLRKEIDQRDMVSSSLVFSCLLPIFYLYLELLQARINSGDHRKRRSNEARRSQGEWI